MNRLIIASIIALMLVGCGRNGPIPVSTMTCDGCFTPMPDPTPARECPMRIKYVVTNRQDEPVEEGYITRNLDCCNTDGECKPLDTGGY